MREIPIPVYLSWPTPNYDNPETRGSALLIVNVIFIILVSLAYFVRISSRLRMKGGSGWDDAMITLAYICTVGLTTTVLLANQKYGWDRHTWDVRPDMLENANIVAFVAKLLFTCSTTFTRISLILFYYRLIKDAGIHAYVWVLHASMAFMIALWIVFMCLGVFFCVPTQAYWKFNMEGAKCMDEGVATMTVGVLGCIAELLVTLLPVPLIMRLQMPLSKRIGVVALLTGGFCVVVAGAIRSYYVWKGLIDSWDEAWFTYPLWLSAALEVDIGVICACGPSLKAVLWVPFKAWSSQVYSRYSGPRTQPETISLDSQEPINNGKFTRLDSKKHVATASYRNTSDSTEDLPRDNAATAATDLNRYGSQREAFHLPVGIPTAPIELEDSSSSSSSSDARHAHHRKRTEEWEISKEISFVVEASTSPDHSRGHSPFPSSNEAAYRAKQHPAHTADWGSGDAV